MAIYSGEDVQFAAEIVDEVTGNAITNATVQITSITDPGGTEKLSSPLAMSYDTALGKYKAVWRVPDDASPGIWRAKVEVEVEAKNIEYIEFTVSQ